MSERAHDALRAHAVECSECAVSPAVLDRITAALAAPVALDEETLSRNAMRRAAPALAARAREAFWTRLAHTLGLALLPLPILLAVDVALLAWLYARMTAWLPAEVASYVVGSYAVSAVVALGLVYALIPLLLGRRRAEARRPA
ncbi:MAG: hypothetical protein AB7V27_05630 [Candidatus Binatia bacterium]